MDNIWLVGSALGFVGILIVIGMWLLGRTPEAADFETRKLRFAAATFTGILLLIIFASVVYYASPSPGGAGKEIFGTIVPAVTPIAGAIVGYLFAAKTATAADRAAEEAARKTTEAKAAEEEKTRKEAAAELAKRKQVPVEQR